jgi:hypothetical protein
MKPRIPSLRRPALIGHGEAQGHTFIGPIAPSVPLPRQHSFLGFLLDEEWMLRG